MRIKKLKGVIRKKKIEAITIGAITFPNVSPNLIHEVFNILNKLGKNIKATRKTIEMETDQVLIGSLFKSGQIPMIIKITKNNNPNFFSGEILIIFFYPFYIDFQLHLILYYR
mgnify:CR=1 FL=1|jgi:hypothetical protein